MLAFLSDLISFGNTYIGTYLLIVLLINRRVLFYISKRNFVQFRMMKEMIQSIRGWRWKLIKRWKGLFFPSLLY